MASRTKRRNARLAGLSHYNRSSKGNKNYSGFEAVDFLAGHRFEDGEKPEVIQPSKQERAAFNVFHAEEHAPPDHETMAEQKFAIQTYVTKDGEIKTGRRWNVCRVQLCKAATSWRKADDAGYDIRAIEPKSLSPWPNLRANMDFEGMSQISQRWENMGDK